MNKIIKRYFKEFGYKPTIAELYRLYTIGLLTLSDKEVNIIIKINNR